IVGFDISKVIPTNIATAKLVMTVQKNSAEWGSKGRTIAVLPLKAATFAYSGPKLPPIPAECCHPFHFKAATYSGECCHPLKG
ncbi:MAG: hypothetical protein WCP25_10555, partial [Polynucleobacter sp.]